MSEVSWKNKYEALKAKFMESVDTAFRLGFEQGAQQAQVDSVMQQQQQQADEMQQQAQDPNGDGGQDDQNGEGGSGEQVPGDSQNPQGSELDQHINTLESMVKKGEMSQDDLLKAVNGFRNLQKTIKLNNDLKKSHQAISGIAKALNKPKFKISQQANHNMTDTAKKSVTLQEKIVTDVMKSWAEEEQRAGKDIINVLNVEGLIKKD